MISIHNLSTKPLHHIDILYCYISGALMPNVDKNAQNHAEINKEEEEIPGVE